MVQDTTTNSGAGAGTGEQPPQKRPRLSFDETIEVLVGDLETKFTVYKHPICSRSRFFEAASAVKWQCGRKPVTIEDESPETFDHYLRVAYGAPLLETPDNQGNSFLDFVKVYLLADRLGDLKSANALIDEMIRYSDSCDSIPGMPAINLVFEKSAESCPLRRLAIDWEVHETSEGALKTRVQDLPRSFLEAYINEYRRLKSDDANKDRTVREVYMIKARDRERCTYHQHDASHPPCSK